MKQSSLKSELYGTIMFEIKCSMYVPSLISIPFVLSMIWPGQACIKNYKWLQGDNSIHIQRRIMVRVHCPSTYCHLSIYQVSFKSH